MQACLEVADILQKIWPNKDALKLNGWQIRTLDAVRRCRTAALGGHIDGCDGCGNMSVSYNSCRNRHCRVFGPPKCHGEKREDWIAAREAELLPVPYFHVVFTLPSELNQVALYEPKIIYDTLFEAARQTLETFGKNPKYLHWPTDKGIKNGMVAILHTWGQNLSLHPHLHCIVPGGGVNQLGRWQNLRSDGKFLFTDRAMSRVFRAKFMSCLKGQIELEKPLRETLFTKEWVVYAKRPFGNTASVLECLGRYSHKIAISNHLIKSLTDTEITFTYKDYKTQGTKKEMTLHPSEFIRRFAQHILPKGFCKIRHYGMLSSCWKKVKLKNLQVQLKAKIATPKTSLHQVCRCCKVGKLRTILNFDHRGPPAQWYDLLKNKSTSSQP